MANEYEIQRVNANADSHIWDKVKPLFINFYPWDKNGYRPLTVTRLIYTSDHVRVRFEAYEKGIRATNNIPNSPVCQDSCVELFINPCPNKSEQYVNFEINPIGTAHMGIGKDRNKRRLIDGDIYNMVQIKASIEKGQWRIDLCIPFSFFRALFGSINISPGHVMKGNLYKCGDLTEYPHYGCWNPVVWEYPDFHRPECFGKFILE